jgi:hypothetical protein
MTEALPLQCEVGGYYFLVYTPAAMVLPCFIVWYMSSWKNLAPGPAYFYFFRYR